jgi:hypothetical protein
MMGPENQARIRCVIVKTKDDSAQNISVIQKCICLHIRALEFCAPRRSWCLSIAVTNMLLLLSENTALHIDKLCSL